MESQRQFISEFINDSRPKFNKALFERNEDEIVNELMNVIYSCERNNKFFSIKVESYRVVEDYEPSSHSSGTLSVKWNVNIS